MKSENATTLNDKVVAPMESNRTEFKDNKILLFSLITDAKNPHNKNVEDVFHLITGEKLKDATRKVGDLWETGASMDAIREAKTDLLPAVSPANNPRLVIFDFDQHDTSLPIGEVSTWLEGLENFIDRSGIALMRTRTSSGRGLHLYVKTDGSDKMRVYGAAKAFFATGGYKVDDSAGAGNKINTQKFYISHDANARFNPESVIVDASFISKWGEGLFSVPLRDFCAGNEYSYQTEYKNATEGDDWDLVIRNIAAHVERKKPFAAGRSNHTVDLCYLCGKEGVPGDALLDWLIENYADDSFTAYEIETTCFKRYEKGAADSIKEAQRELPSDEYYIDFDKDYPEPEPMLAYKGVLFASEGNISTIVAKQKVGKSFFTSLLEAGYLSGKYGEIEGEAATHDGAVLHFDTEQSALHIAKMQRRLYKMLNWGAKSPVVRFYGLREMSVSERVRFIETEALKYLPRLIVVDGAVDLCSDFNSIEKSNETLHFLMRLSSSLNNHIVTVIHENKADSNARGHCGAFLMQRSESVIQLTKSQNGDYIEVSFPYTRNKSPERFCFEIGLDGLPAEVCPTGQQVPVQSNYALFACILKEPMSYSKLRAAVMEKKGIGERTAEKHITNARLEGTISKDEAGIYSFKNDFEDDVL